MSINPDEMKILKRAIYYSISLKQETKKDEEFRNSPSYKSGIDTQIHFRELLSKELQDRTEQSLLDDDQLCSALSDAIIFLTGYHHGRKNTNEMQDDEIPIKRMQDKFCTKKPSEYID